jgi:hypothetical protein
MSSNDAVVLDWPIWVGAPLCEGEPASPRPAAALFGFCWELLATAASARAAASINARWASAVSRDESEKAGGALAAVDEEGSADLPGGKFRFGIIDSFFLDCMRVCLCDPLDTISTAVLCVCVCEKGGYPKEDKSGSLHNFCDQSNLETNSSLLQNRQCRGLKNLKWKKKLRVFVCSSTDSAEWDQETNKQRQF